MTGAELAREAVDEARDRARRILVERLTDELVTAATEVLTSAAAPSPMPQSPPVPSAEHAASAGQSGAGGWYLFGVAAGADGEGPDLVGLDGRGPVEAVVCEGLVAFAAETDLTILEGLEADADDPEGRLAALARRHDEIVRALHERVSLLPMRLGVVLRTRQDVEALLRDRAPSLHEHLEAITGADEWTCRVRRAPGDGAASSGVAAGSVAEPETGRAYLSRRSHELERRQSAQEQLAASVDSLDAGLRAHATAAAPLGTPEPDSVHAAAYLVPRRAREAFLGVLEQWEQRGAEAALDLALDGPLPPYHFAPQEV
jgi:hypothetical protein